MRLPTCVGCGSVVLELEGQFAKLDSFFLEDGGPPPESAGYWHISCLQGSGYGEAWYRARLANYVGVRRFVEVTHTGAWTVLRAPRTGDAFALGRSGEVVTLTFSGAKSRTVPGGAIYRIDEDFNLELPDRNTIAAIQNALTSIGEFSLLALLDALGIADRIIHLEALEGAVFRYDEALHGHWQPGFVAARAQYGLFVPGELESHVVRKRQAR